MRNRPIIGITLGDPVGVGPEIALKALMEKRVYGWCRPVVLGDRNVLSLTKDSLQLDLDIRSVNSPENAAFHHGTVDVVSLSSLNGHRIQSGRPTVETGTAMVGYILQGIEWAMSRKIAGLVTGPINKMAMHRAGFHFDGHTEILASKTNTPKYVMMLAGKKLRVSLVTIHVALNQVPQMLTSQAIFETLQVTEQGLKESFGIPKPRLAVAGLNPHAGEEGLFGNEEQTIIGPALDQARNAGLLVTGPIPPDTLFYRALKGEWDAVVAMYHDQGLIPFKMVHFEDGVNTTLGLPIVRTSVDHGTAYDIAGTGQANPESMLAAIEMAAMQARNRTDRAGREELKYPYLT